MINAASGLQMGLGFNIVYLFIIYCLEQNYGSVFCNDFAFSLVIRVAQLELEIKSCFFFWIFSSRLTLLIILENYCGNSIDDYRFLVDFLLLL